MDKFSAICNFNAVHNYLMWKYESNLVTTWYHVNAKVLEICMHYDSEELQAVFLVGEMESLVDSEAKIGIEPIFDSNESVIRIRWEW